MAEYLSFEEVLDELDIGEEELKRLISQGELRGFRDGMSMKFKRSDVMNLGQSGNTEPTIILTESDHDLEIPESSDELLLEDSSADDTVLNISDLMDDGGFDDSSDELLIGSSDDLIITPGDSEEAIPTVETPSLSGEDESSIQFIESSEDDTGALMEVAASSDHGGTEAFELIDDSAEDTGAVALIDEDSGDMLLEDSGDWEDAESGDDIAPRSSVSSRAARSSRRAMATAATIQQKTPHTAWTIMLLLAAVLLLIPTAVVFNAFKGVEPEWVMGLAKSFNGMTEFFYKLFAATPK